jgi:dCTP deaminase
MPKDLAAYVIGKSSWGRRGLIIATATAVHPGFVGCLTLELSNVGEVPIEIKPGMRICQLCFHSMEQGTSTQLDRSQFACTRRPTLGVVQHDQLAALLAAAHDPRMPIDPQPPSPEGTPTPENRPEAPRADQLGFQPPS